MGGSSLLHSLILFSFFVTLRFFSPNPAHGTSFQNANATHIPVDVINETSFTFIYSPSTWITRSEPLFRIIKGRRVPDGPNPDRPCSVVSTNRRSRDAIGSGPVTRNENSCTQFRTNGDKKVFVTVSEYAKYDCRYSYERTSSIRRPR